MDLMMDYSVPTSSEVSILSISPSSWPSGSGAINSNDTNGRIFGGGEDEGAGGDEEELWGMGTANDGICDYKGTDYLEVKILLIGVFATGLALLSFLFNAFFSLVFALNSRLRRSALFYFGVLALLDLALAINYLALMSVPVYMDQFHLLWLYHLFLAYLRPMLALSHFAMFASVLMILLATAERLLQTFSGQRMGTARRFLQRHRPQVTLLMMVAAFAYKLCIYFEIEVVEHANCTNFERFEVKSAVDGPEWYMYRFWWMFVSRNMIDHLLPFFLLIILNFFIIRALTRERIRATHSFASATASTGTETLLRGGHGGSGRSSAGSGRSQRGTGGSGRGLRDSLRQKVRRTKIQKHVSSAEDQAQKKNLRAATRTLIAVVTMYLMSKVLQVAVTFFETFGTEEMIEAANYGPFRPLYSYVNDVISILTLLSSLARFPVYCACNKPILKASKATLERLIGQRQRVQRREEGERSRKESGQDGEVTGRRGRTQLIGIREAPPLRIRRKSPGAVKMESRAENGRHRGTEERRKDSSESSESPPKSPKGKRRVLKYVLNGRDQRQALVNGPAAARIAISGIDEEELVAMMFGSDGNCRRAKGREGRGVILADERG